MLPFFIIPGLANTWYEPGPKLSALHGGGCKVPEGPSTSRVAAVATARECRKLCEQPWCLGFEHTELPTPRCVLNSAVFASGSSAAPNVTCQSKVPLPGWQVVPPPEPLTQGRGDSMPSEIASLYAAAAAAATPNDAAAAGSSPNKTSSLPSPSSSSPSPSSSSPPHAYHSAPPAAAPSLFMRLRDSSSAWFITKDDAAEQSPPPPLSAPPDPVDFFTFKSIQGVSEGVLMSIAFFSALSLGCLAVELRKRRGQPLIILGPIFFNPPAEDKESVVSFDGFVIENPAAPGEKQELAMATPEICLRV